MSYTFAIGDVHGCLDQLKHMISRIEISRPEGGKIVFLGDYVDRGPDSKGVIDLIIAGPQKNGWKWVALKGNHEDMMVGAIAGEYDPKWWVGNGGSNTLGCYDDLAVSDDHVAWAKNLPLFHTDQHRIFVHAGVDPTIPLDHQSERDLLWLRVAPHFSGEYWGRHLVHGHTPSPSNPVTVGNRTNVDSGAVFGGKLSCAVFHDGTPGAPIEFIQV